MLSRKEVFKKLNEIKKLPSPSGTTLQVILTCHDEACSMKDIADAIKVDPALSAELLKYANSFFLTSGIQIASIQKAVVKLGLRTVVNLSLGLSLLAGNKNGKCKMFDYERFWSMSLLQAIAAKHIATAGTEFDREELFVCALLSNMGQLALASAFPQEYEDLLNEFGFDACGEWNIALAADIAADRPSNRLRKTLEREQFDLDSSELTTELFLHWGLPAHFALAAGFHDDLGHAELGTAQTRKIAEILNLSRQLSEICCHFLTTRQQLNAIEIAAEKFAITKEKFGPVFDTIISEWLKLGEMFEIHTHQILSYNDLYVEKTLADYSEPLD